MIDLKLIAEAITGVAAIVAAIRSSFAHKEARKARAETEIVRTEVRAVLQQTQAIHQSLSHVQQTNVNVFTGGHGVQTTTPTTPIFWRTDPPQHIADTSAEPQR